MELGRRVEVAGAGGALLDRLEPELVAVEGARPFEVLSGSLVTAWPLLSGPGMVVVISGEDKTRRRRGFIDVVRRGGVAAT